MTITVASQFKNLKTILKANKKSSLHTHLGLNAISNYSNFDNLYEEFQTKSPVFTYNEFVDFLGNMSGNKSVDPVEILTQKNIISSEKPIGYVKTGCGPVPVTTSSVKQMFNLEKQFIKSIRHNGKSVKGNIFHIYEGHSIERKDDVIQAKPGVLLSQYRPWPWRNRFFPDVNALKDIGKSRYQSLHGFIDELEEYGEKIEILICRPQVLTEISLLLAQREGRFIHLKELCPNLKVYVHYGIPVTLYQTELSYFFAGMNVSFVEFYNNAHSCFASQNDSNIKSWLHMFDETGVFYEFIPIKDLNPTGTIKKSYTRLHVGQVKKDEQYMLVASNTAGMCSIATGDIIKVVSKEPFIISYQRPTELLNGFGEELALDKMEALINAMNVGLKSQGFFVREYMIADDVIKQKQPMWLMEISRPAESIKPALLQSLANKLHTELGVKNVKYYDAFKAGVTKAPLVHFVSMGTFSNMGESFKMTHLDNSQDASLVKNVIRRAFGKVAIQAQEF